MHDKMLWQNERKYYLLYIVDVDIMTMENNKNYTITIQAKMV